MKGGYGFGASISVGIVQVNAEINFGSLEVTFDKNGQTANDTADFVLSVSAFDLAAIGVEISKEAPSVDSKTLHDTINNAWAAETEVKPIANIGGIGLSADKENELILEVGAQAIAGGSLSLNVSETVDLLKYVSSKVLSYLND